MSEKEDLFKFGDHRWELDPTAMKQKVTGPDGKEYLFESVKSTTLSYSGIGPMDTHIYLDGERVPSVQAMSVVLDRTLGSGRMGVGDLITICFGELDGLMKDVLQELMGSDTPPTHTLTLKTVYVEANQNKVAQQEYVVRFTGKKFGISIDDVVAEETFLFDVVEAPIPMWTEVVPSK